MRFVRRIWSLLISDSPSLIAIGTLLASALSIASAPIVARAIGPAGRGESAAAIAAFAILPIVLALGVPLEVRRSTASEGGSEAIRSARDLWILATVPSALIALLLDQTIFVSLGSPERVAIFVGLVLTPFSMSWLSDIGVLVARRRYRAILLLRITSPLLYILLIIGAIASNTVSVTFVIAANVVGNLITCAVGWWLVRVSVRGARQPHLPLIRRGLSYAGGAIADVASGRLPQLLVLPLIGATQSGFFSVAMTIASIPLSVGHAIASSYFTDVAAASATERSAIKGEAVRSIIWLAAIACVALALLSPIGIPILFGSEFEEAVAPSLISLVGAFGMTVGFVCAMMLAAEGKGVRMTIAQVCSLLSSILLLILLGPTLGAVGSTIAVSASFVVATAVLLFFLGLPARALIPRRSDLAKALRRLFSAPQQ